MLKSSVYARRSRMVDLVSENLKASVIIKVIVGEFGVSERQVWRDWGSRE